MPGVKRPIIQDCAVICVKRTATYWFDRKDNGDNIEESQLVTFIEGLQGNNIGEANNDEPGMTPAERQQMIGRLERSISTLMDEAHENHKNRSHQANTSDEDGDYITRLSTHEFFFYTQEPLTVTEFEELQNKIADKAKTLPAGVQLILGSFAVKTEDNKVMNVTAHITCGTQPKFHFMVKNHTSPVDFRYKTPDGHGNRDTLEMLDAESAPQTMPQIMINGTTHSFSFNNIISCVTPGGTPFLTAVDICLDHHKGVAKTNIETLARENPKYLQQPVSHIVVSNSVGLLKEKSLGSAVMHVDPDKSIRRCKESVPQQRSTMNTLEFGKDKCVIYRVAAEPVHKLNATEIYKLSNPLASTYADGAKFRVRKHKYTASVESIVAKNEFDNYFHTVKEKYQQWCGDNLKIRILEDFKAQIKEVYSLDDLKMLKERLEKSHEYQVLKKGQDRFTQWTGIKTSSQDAFEDMFKQQKKYIEGMNKSNAP